MDIQENEAMKYFQRCLTENHHILSMRKTEMFKFLCYAGIDSFG